MKKILALIGLLALAGAAWAQGSGTLPLGQIAVGRGPGKTGFSGIAPGANGNCVVVSGGAFVSTTCPGGGGGIPGGANGTIQYNNAGAFGGIALVPLANGGLRADVSASSTYDMLMFNGVGYSNYAFNLLVNLVCTASPSGCYKVFGFMSPYWFGAVCDGATNDAAALQNMLTAASGKRVLIPGVTCVSNSTLVPPASTTISGINRENSIITGSALPMFSIQDKAGVRFENFWMKGTRSATTWVASPVGPIDFLHTASATGDVDLTITGMKFSNFNTSYWFHIVSSTTNFYNIVNFTFTDNWVLTAAGDIPADANPLNNNNYGIYMLSSSAGHGRIDSPIIKNNRFDSPGLCMMINVTGNSYKLQITENLIFSPGTITPRTNGHCLSGDGNTDLSYGINVYDAWGDGNPPTNFLIANNSIISPYGTGIYIVGDGTVGHTSSAYNSSVGSLIANNVISGQLSQTDATLPRGAIAVALTTDVTITGNFLKSNFGGIVATSQMTGVVSIIGNTCSTATGAVTSTPFCYKVQPGAASGTTRRHIIKGNYGESTAAASGNVITLSSGAAFQFGDLEVSENSIMGGFNGLSGVNQFVTGLFSLTNNKFVNANTGTILDISGLTGSVYLMGNSVFNSGTGVNGITFATLPTGAINGSQVFLSNGAPASAPCTGASTGSTAMRQNGAWKCF